MTQLFLAYRGAHLEISHAFDDCLRRMYPETDWGEQYRKADMWLTANPKKRWRNMTRGFTNWYLKEVRNAPRLAKEVAVGGGPVGKMKEAAKRRLENRK